MKRFLLSFIVPILTFCVGVYIYRISSPNVSLETVSKYTYFYNGMNVEIESYLQAVSYDDDDTLFLGDFSNPTGTATYIHPSDTQLDLSHLKNELNENFSDQKFKRVKVLVRGKVKDNCNIISDNGAISFGCCFGKTMTIKAREVIQLAPVEDYSLPE